MSGITANKGNDLTHEQLCNKRQNANTLYKSSFLPVQSDHTHVPITFQNYYFTFTCVKSFVTCVYRYYMH